MKKILALVLTLVLALSISATALGEGYKIGFSDIYLTPSWMQQMKGMLDTRVDYWKEKGVISEFTLANANGDNSKQIADIQNMVAEGYDAIIIIAGSATALNNAVDEAMAKGVVVVNTNSLVTTPVTSVLATSDEEYGATCAQVFPGWTWQTMTLVAYNLAVNVAALHRSGIVAGDLNPANMMVDPTNHLVSMIDCDSYDIQDPDTGEHFPCMVGSAEVLAPELQMVGNLSSPKAKFTKESDNFSLAILIFKLLMNGYDPFAKRSLNPGGSTPAVTNVNMDILTGASVYVRAIPGKARPLGAPDFSILPQEVQDLFQKVFTYGAYPDFMKKIPLRPTAEQWCTALDKMYLSMNQKSQWTQCAADPHHLYPAGLSSCPWCRARKDLEDYLKQSFGTAAVPAAPAAPANQTGPAAAAASAQRSPWLFLALMTAFSVLGGALFGPQLAAVSSMELSASDLQIITSLVGAGISIAIAVHFWKLYPAAASPWPYWLFSASMCLLTPLATVVLAAAVAMVLEVLKMVFMCLFGVGLFMSLLGGG